MLKMVWVTATVLLTHKNIHPGLCVHIDPHLLGETVPTSLLMAFTHNLYGNECSALPHQQLVFAILFNNFSLSFSTG